MMMKNYDESVEINYNSNWLYILDHPHNILIIGGSGSDKTNVLQNLIKHQEADTDTIYSYGKTAFESKYEFLISRKEKVGIKKLKNLKAFTDYYRQLMMSMKILIVFYMIADMEANM